MIAYFFSISHTIFGNTFFSINIVGFFCLILGAFYIYKTGCLLRNQKTGLISALIWVVLPTTTESIFVRVLYDSPLNLFTIMSFYYFARFISLKRFIDLYLSAVFIGAMLLSKYTAVVSVLGFLLYVVFSKQRELFKSIHFYLACLLVLIMVSPVIYWNINHHWISITYLLNFHSQLQTKSTIAHSLSDLLIALIINFSIFLILAAWGWFKYRETKSISNNSVLEFTYVVLLVSIIFWLVTTLLGGDSRAIYLTPLGMNIALVAGYTIARYQYNRFLMLVYPFFLLISLGMIIVNSWPIATYLKKGRVYSLVKKTLHEPEIIKKGQPVVTGYYTNAAAFNFFMPNEPVYAIPCGDINQYHYWNEAFLNDLSKGKIEKISYVDFRDTKQCPEKFFNKCQAVATVSSVKMIPVIHKLTKPVYLYVYECSLPRKLVAEG